MTDGGPTDGAQLEARLEEVEATLANLRAELMTATDRDIPLVKGTVRSILATDIETIEELPDAGRSFRAEIDDLAARLETLEERVAALGDVGTEPSTKEEKYAAVLAFAANKHSTNGKVAVSPTEIKGCTGVSRRYAYDLMDAMGTDVTGVQVREPQRVTTGSDVTHKQKALLVDCERVHANAGVVNQFTTGGETTGSG